MNIYKILGTKLTLIRWISGFLAVIPLFIGTLHGQSTNPAPYCQVTDDCGFVEINDFSFGSFSNNNTGCNNDGSVTYWDNFGAIDQVNIGQSVPISVNGGYTFGDIRVWIDWNQDNTFQPGESVITGGSSVSGNITVPSDAKPGITRIRVMFMYFGPPSSGSSCNLSSFSSWGEIEDYDFEVLCPSGLDIGISSVTPKTDDDPYFYEDFDVTISNNADSTLQADSVIPVYYETTLSKQTKKFNYKLQSDLACGETVKIDVGNINMACDGSHKLKVWTGIAGDNKRTNDTLTKTYRNGSLYNESFEASSIPSGWQSNSISDFNINTNCAGSGSNSLFIDGFTGNWIESSNIDLSNKDSVILSFDYREAENCGGEDPDGGEGVSVQYWNGSGWITVYQTDGDNDIRSFKEERIKITQGLTQDFKVRFEVYDASANSNDSWLFDDITIFEGEKASSTPIPASIGINVSDSVYDNSPVNISSLNNTPTVGYEWIINGETFATNKDEIRYTFERTPNDTKDTIKLITWGCFGGDTSTKIVDIKLPNNPPQSKFIADKNIIDSLEKVAFTNLTQNGPTSFLWDISPKTLPGGDLGLVWASTDYMSFNPVTVYEDSAQFLSPGVYDVSLQTQNSVGSDTELKKGYVRVREYHGICGASMDTDSVGTLYDGDFSSYPADANCNYVIQPCANEIKLNLDKLDLKKGEAFLKIYDGASASGEPLWDQSEYGPNGITGDTSHPGYQETLTANSGSVFVQFNSGSDPDGEGFRLMWNGNTQSLKPLQTSISGDTAVCQDINANFTANSNATGSEFNWYFNDSNLSGNPDGTGENFHPLISDSKNDTVTLVTNHCGRLDTVHQTVKPIITNQTPNVRFSANQTTIGSGQTIQLNEETDGCIVGREWIIQPNTFDYVNGTSDNSKNPEVRFNESGIYRVQLVDTANGGQVGSQAKPGYITVLDYCNPSVVNLKSDIGVSRFKLDEIDQSSTVGKDAYQNFIDNTPAATLEKGGSFPLTIERITNINPVNYKVWIDFNKDGDFKEANELVFENRYVSGNNLKGQLTIPETVSFGNYRLRVGANLGSVANTPCGPNKYGEFEDYNVQIVPDNNAPEILTQGGDTVQIAACHSAHRYIQGAFARDEVDDTINDLTVMGSVDSTSPGFYQIDYQVTDNSGNQATHTQVFEVLSDQMAPHFDLAGSDTLMLGVNQPFIDPGYTGLTDNCSGVSNIAVDSSSLNQQALGTYPVHYTATDNNGNQRQKTRMVHVVDTVAPNATLAGSATMNHNVNQSFNDPGLKTLSDNYWDSSEISVNVMGTVNYQQPGQYQLEYHMVDGSGNMAMLKRMVNVQDLTAPSVEAPANDTIVLDVNNSLTIMDHITISDNFSQASIMDTSGSFYLNFPMGHADQLGNYSLDFVVADLSGNQTPVDLVVKVVDRVAPVISLKGPDFVVLPRFENTPYESTDSVQVSDNYYQDFQISVDTSGSYFDQYKENRATGAYDIIYTAKDPSGNVSEEVVRNVQIGEASGIEENAGNQFLNAYPNPTQGQLNVEIDGQEGWDGKLSLVNSVGQTVMEIDNGTIRGSYNIDLQEFDAGVYFLKLNTGEDVKLQEIVLTK